MARNENQQCNSDQRGMAAIMVTVILMIVISIIVLGFSQVVRREQRNALDNQLSTQAYYAAESGVNLAQKKIKDRLSSPTPTLVEKNSCGASSDYGITTSDFLIGQEAEITCLLINSRLSTLEYQKIDMHSVPMYVKSAVGGIDKIYVSWQSSGGSTATTGCPSTVPASNTFTAGWACDQPLLRLDLVPANVTNTGTAAAGQYTAFLYPTTAGGAATYNAGTNSTGKDNIVAARCQTATDTLHPKICTIAVDVSALGQQAYAARVMSVYGESDVTVFATDAGGTRQALIEGQVLIDATAKASDVLKRIQARMSLTAGVPDFAITAGGGGICKRYQKTGSDVVVAPGSPTFCDIP